ncbi:TetR/AcrR family transcriptional regulator [Vibrio sp. SCSIO 43137]|uniref:TetR/AcrR family transcriptional regulator n=1 Tax=Vibrio sp. SCSIO 43137 TaxID=3021011 RepID=UPI0023080F49|nr:TetR/AcrR family transcriptional regulator [Vibrio sp. SCSIO 43137]WCE30831.1 TetR/AcrR family transcriptional regulator [Vibrio sp. SCSIO 43137]
MSVKEKKRGRPKGSGNQLSTEKIMQAAKSLMKLEGKIPSIRKLATELDVDAMAIYYYFDNKTKLLEAITTSLIDDIYQPTSNQEWQTELFKLSKSYLTLLHTYPGLLETLLGMSCEGPAEVFSQRFYTVIKPLNLSEESARSGLHLLVDYLHGFALAMSCNNSDCEITEQMMEGPLKLYCRGLESFTSDS